MSARSVAASSNNLDSGTLVLVSTPIGNLADLSPRAADALRTAALICCEDTRHSAKLLSHAGISGVRLAVCNEHTEHQRAAEVIEILGRGSNVAMVTDAGTPGISDPGARLARAVIDAGLAVSAVPGPAAFVTAVVLSGLDVSRFVFDGFIPRSGTERRRRLAEIAAERRTTVLYEAPHRIARTVADLAHHCGGQRRVALARELTKLHEEVWRGTLDDALVHVAGREPRGEFVIVIEGAPPAPMATDDDLRAALGEQLLGGADHRHAVAVVTDRFGVPKRRVYDLGLEIKTRR